MLTVWLRSRPSQRRDDRVGKAARVLHQEAKEVHKEAGVLQLEAGVLQLEAEQAHKEEAESRGPLKLVVKVEVEPIRGVTRVLMVEDAVDEAEVVEAQIRGAVEVRIRGVAGAVIREAAPTLVIRAPMAEVEDEEEAMGEEEVMAGAEVDQEEADLTRCNETIGGIKDVVVQIEEAGKMDVMILRARITVDTTPMDLNQRVLQGVTQGMR